MNKIAVYGGGIVAMLLAVVFKRRGYDIELWRPHLKQGAVNRRFFALGHQAMKFLQELQVFTDISVVPQITAVADMLIWDAKTAAQVYLSASEIGRAALTHIVDETYLWQRLQALMTDYQINIFDLAEHEICAQQHHQWYLTCSRADFLCIAEGAQSKLRQQLQVPSLQYSYQQRAIVATVTVDRPMRYSAFQVFGPHGPLAFLPIDGDNAYAIVWSQNTVRAEQLLALSAMDLQQELGQAIDFHLGNILEVTDLRSYPLHCLHARQYVGDHWLLAGDTAHHFHPLAGLGLNMGIADVRCLDELLERQRLSPVLLQYYQRARKAELTPIIYGMAMLKKGFEIEMDFWIKCRSFMMDMVDHQSLIKKIMMQFMQKL